MGTLLEKRLQCQCFPVNFVKFLQTLSGGCLFTISALHNSLDRKSQNIREFLLSLSFQSFIFVFSISFSAVFSLRAATVTNTILFLKKENNRKKKVFKSKSVNVFLSLFQAFFCPEFIFCAKLHGQVLFETRIYFVA